MSKAQTSNNTQIKKSTTIFTNMISVHVNSVNHIGEGSYQLNATHYGSNNKNFTFDVLVSDITPPGVGDNVILMDYIPQNRLPDGSHTHRLVLNNRSQIIPINQGAVVNTFVANGRLASDASHYSDSNANGPWKSTGYSTYVSYWDGATKSVQDFVINVSQFGSHIPGLFKGNCAIFKGSLTANTSKTGDQYFNVSALSTNYGNTKK